jgi:YVTN family beta-propeller protein
MLTAALFASSHVRFVGDESRAEAPSPKSAPAFRSPVDLALSPDGKWLVTANETSDSISLIDAQEARVVAELPCGDHPAAVAWCLDGNHVLVTCSHSSEVVTARVSGGKLHHESSIAVGYEPVGLAVSPDGQTAYLGLAATGEVAVLDLAGGRVAGRIAVGNWPRYLAVSPDGTRLAVGCSGDGAIAVLDTARREVLYHERLTGGINIGQMKCSEDGEYVYFPWMVYRSNPITPGNIRLGWVLASPHRACTAGRS